MKLPPGSLSLKWLKGAVLQLLKLLTIRCFRVCDMTPLIIFNFVLN